MNACSAVHGVANTSSSDRIHLEFKITAQTSTNQDPRLKTTPCPPGTFSASHLFSWILQTGKLTGSNHYVQLVVHLGITGSHASRRAPRAIPEETRRLQVLPTVPVWQLKPVHQLRLRLATCVVCCDFKFRDSVLNSCLCLRLLPPLLLLLWCVLSVFSAILHCSPVFTCLFCTFHRQLSEIKNLAGYDLKAWSCCRLTDISI